MKKLTPEQEAFNKINEGQNVPEIIPFPPLTNRATDHFMDMVDALVICAIRDVMFEAAMKGDGGVKDPIKGISDLDSKKLLDNK
jgi:hypothetical protein